MKLSQSSLTIIGILCAVIWLGCFYDDHEGADNFIIEGVLLPSTKIAFVSSSGTSDDICVINADDKNVVNITNSDAIDSEPDWSPDGRKIVFVRFEGQYAIDRRHNIYVMNADGTDVVRMTKDRGYSAPDWSPDGKKIAFVSSREGGRDIYVMNADGTDVVRMTTHEAADIDPAWSPDGQKIAFVSEREDNLDIYVMNADGTNVVRMTTHEDHDFDLAWSPDGQKIAFASEREGALDIYVMNADGTNEVNITNNPEHYDSSPAWGLIR